MNLEAAKSYVSLAVASAMSMFKNLMVRTYVRQRNGALRWDIVVLTRRGTMSYAQK